MPVPKVVRLAKTAMTLINPAELRLRVGRCPRCGPTALIKLAHDPLAVRCVRCRSSGIHLAILKELDSRKSKLARMTAYEMSSRGPVFTYLKSHVQELVFSEYFDDAAPGTVVEGVRCEDVQALTFKDGSFDLCTSTEVFEHVPDDMQGFREIRRVLRQGGSFVFTVPLTDQPMTVERARINGGAIEYLLPAEYHCDVIRGQRQILVYRDYGRDLPDRLMACGFKTARIQDVDASSWWGLGSEVVVATA